MKTVDINDIAKDIFNKSHNYVFSLKCVEYKAHLKYIIIASRKVYGLFNTYAEVYIGPASLDDAFKLVDYENAEITNYIIHKYRVYGRCSINNHAETYSNYDIDDAKKMLVFMYKFQQYILEYKVNLKKKHLDNQIYIDKFNKQSKSYIHND